jgi:hypothetical protein
MMDIEHPEVSVKMIGEDGNAFAILGRVRSASKNAGISQEEIDAFMTEATAGDYDHLLQAVIKWVNVDW